MAMFQRLALVVSLLIVVSGISAHDARETIVVSAITTFASSVYPNPKNTNAPGTTIVFTSVGKTKAGLKAVTRGVIVKAETDKSGGLYAYATIYWELPGGDIQAAGKEYRWKNGTYTGVLTITGGTGKYLGASGTNTLKTTASGVNTTLKVYY